MNAHYSNITIKMDNRGSGKLLLAINHFMTINQKGIVKQKAGNHLMAKVYNKFRSKVQMSMKITNLCHTIWYYERTRMIYRLPKSRIKSKILLSIN
jgi:hypothetical protein